MLLVRLKQILDFLMNGRSCTAWLVLVMSFFMAQAKASDGEISYRREVLPLLTKLGCNSGPCHGNLTGKGGLKLSLRGENAPSDWLTLTHDAFGRRVSTSLPQSSLLLAKPMGALAHEGGIRFKAGDSSYEILAGWIAQGARDDGDAVGSKKLTGLKVTPEQVWLEAGQPRNIKIKV